MRQVLLDRQGYVPADTDNEAHQDQVDNELDKLQYLASEHVPLQAKSIFWIHFEVITIVLVFLSELPEVVILFIFPSSAATAFSTVESIPKIYSFTPLLPELLLPGSEAELVP